MPMPKTVKVGPYVIHIEEKEDLRYKDMPEDVKDDQKENKLMGYADRENARIVIEKKMHEDMRRSTLFHEVLHMITFINGFSAGPPHDEEMLVSGIDSLILMVLKDNPDLVMYLIEV